MWNKVFPNGKKPTAEEFAEQWILFKIFDPNGVYIRGKNNNKIDIKSIIKGEI